MKILTSLNPSHPPRQQLAIDSWYRLGLPIYSMNHISEPFDIKHVNVTTTNRCGTPGTFLEKYTPINALIDFAKTFDDDIVCITNSDIEFEMNDKILEQIYTIDGFIYIKRYNYTSLHADAKQELYGIDTFIIKKKDLNVFPKTELVMGQCMWDYWLPFCAAKAKIPLHVFDKPMCFHKTHKRAWSDEQWEHTAHIMQKELSRWERDYQEMCIEIRKEIQKNTETHHI